MEINRVKFVYFYKFICVTVSVQDGDLKFLFKLCSVYMEVPIRRRMIMLIDLYILNCVPFAYLMSRIFYF